MAVECESQVFIPGLVCKDHANLESALMTN